jgi:hypothetical protein
MSLASSLGCADPDAAVKPELALVRPEVVDGLLHVLGWSGAVLSAQ